MPIPRHSGSAGVDESAEVLEAIRQSGAKLLFLGIGCPKQEIWMAKYKDQLPLVMLGVGAAFFIPFWRTSACTSLDSTLWP